MSRKSLCLLLILVLFTACTGFASANGEALDSWVTPEKKTLTFLTHSGYNSDTPPITNDLPKYKELERLTNVHIEFEVILTSEFSSIVNARIASGENLPDIICYNGDLSKLSELVDDDVIISQDDLYEKCYPYTQALIAGESPYSREEYKSLYSDMSVNGVFYGPTHIVPARTQQQGLMINKFWLERLGLEMPTTVDELYDVLVAFRDQDANGNGDPSDEIPLVSESYCLSVIANYFGLEFGGSASGWSAADGKITYERATENYREFLRYMNKLYNEKLLDADFMKTDLDALNEYAANDKCGVINWWIQSMDKFSAYSPYSGEGYNLDVPVFPALPPLTSALGGGYIYNRKGNNNDMMVITTACKDPELAARWIDYVFAAPESMDIVSYGVLGESYNIVDGKIEHIFDESGAWLRTKVGGGQQPHAYIENNEYLTQLASAWKVERWAELDEYYKEGTVYNLRLLPDEAQTIADNSSDLSTYVNEAYTAFILGTKDINDDGAWQEYQDTLKRLGLDIYTQMYQQAYDRANVVK